MKKIKPLNRKSYGSIPHLSNSKLGKGDHHIHSGQEIILIKKLRDKHDVVIVQEKYDGSNVSVCKLNGNIIPLTRSGYIANTSPYKQHKLFYDWALSNKVVFDKVLNEGERICGEWLAMAHGIKYTCFQEPFVVFDLFNANNERLLYNELISRVSTYFYLPYMIENNGNPIKPEEAYKQLFSRKRHLEVFNSEKPEGLVYRVERKGKVDFLAKWVRQDFEPGKYFSEITGEDHVWNWGIKQDGNYIFCK